MVSRQVPEYVFFEIETFLTASEKIEFYVSVWLKLILLFTKIPTYNMGHCAIKTRNYFSSRFIVIFQVHGPVQHCMGLVLHANNKGTY